MDKKASATHFNPRGGIPDHEAYACESVSFSASAELYSSVPGHVHRNQLQTQDVSDGEGPVLLHAISLAVHLRESGMNSCISQDACALHVFISGSGSRIPRPVHHKAVSTKFACPCSGRSLLALNLTRSPELLLEAPGSGYPGGQAKDKLLAGEGSQDTGGLPSAEVFRMSRRLHKLGH